MCKTASILQPAKDFKHNGEVRELRTWDQIFAEPDLAMIRSFLTLLRIRIRPLLELIWRIRIRTNNTDPDLVNGLYRKVARKIKEGRKHCMKTLFCLKFKQIFLVQEKA